MISDFTNIHTYANETIFLQVHNTIELVKLLDLPVQSKFATMVILVLIDLLFILNDIETCFVMTFLMILSIFMNMQIR